MFSKLGIQVMAMLLLEGPPLGSHAETVGRVRAVTQHLLVKALTVQMNNTICDDLDQ